MIEPKKTMVKEIYIEDSGIDKLKMITLVMENGDIRQPYVTLPGLLEYLTSEELQHRIKCGYKKETLEDMYEIKGKCYYLPYVVIILGLLALAVVIASCLFK